MYNDSLTLVRSVLCRRSRVLSTTDVPLVPTPIAQGFKTLSMRGADGALVRFALLSVLQDKTDVDYDVVQFIQHVLKFTPEDIPERAEGYRLSEDGCKSYANRTYQKLDKPQEQEFGGERACCEAFQEIVWDLVRQLQPTAEDPRSFPAQLKFLHDRVVKGNFASYKPDFSYGQPFETREWEFLGACGEMKKTRASRYLTARKKPITMDQIRQVLVFSSYFIYSRFSWSTLGSA